MPKARATHDVALEALLAGGAFHIERHVADAMGAAHWHEHVEVNLLLNGRMTYLFNGRREQVGAGRLVLFWAAIPHRTIDVEADTRLICAYLPLIDFLALSVDRQVKQSVMQGAFLSDARPDLTDGATAARWAADWQAASEARRRLIGEEVRLRIRRFVLDQLDAPAKAPGRANSGPSASRSIVRHAEALADLVNLHFPEHLTLQRLADLAGIHPSTANKSFRRVLGLSVNEYVIRYRLAQAMQRLADTDEPILQIAFDCGFGSSSQFYDVFRQRIGTTPRAFRSSVRQRIGSATGQP
jgi:AraC family transcriptional regulator, melibiose operon regulatory protein